MGPATSRAQHLLMGQKRFAAAIHLPRAMLRSIESVAAHVDRHHISEERAMPHQQPPEVVDRHGDLLLRLFGWLGYEIVHRALHLSPPSIRAAACRTASGLRQAALWSSSCPRTASSLGSGSGHRWY